MAAIHQNSSDFADSHASLPPTQAQVIAALAQGHTITAAAREAGIHRTTIHHWLRNEPDFKTAVENSQREYVATLNDEMRELSALALQTLRGLLEDPTASPAVRLKAALAVLQRPKFPNQPWNLPERIESPQTQYALDTLAEIEVEYRATRMARATQAAAEKADAPPVEPEPSGPQRPVPNTQYPLLIARCSPCPCGSGRKYKRCCGTASPGIVGPSASPHSSATTRAA